MPEEIQLQKSKYNGSLEIYYPAHITTPVWSPIKRFIAEEEKRRFTVEKEITYDERIKDLQRRTFDACISTLFLDLINIENKFSSLTERQLIWVKFKEEINTLWDYASDDDDSKSILSLLIYSVKNLKAENMKKSQLKGFEKILALLKSQKISEKQLFTVNDILLKYNIPAIRFPKGAAELCD